MEQKWQCTRCKKLLGIQRGDRLHIRSARGQEYIAALPATCVCRGCGTLNERRPSLRNQPERAPRSQGHIKSQVGS